MGGPAPYGRRRAIRCTSLRSCRSYPCRDRTSGRGRYNPFCHGDMGIPTRTHAVRCAGEDSAPHHSVADDRRQRNLQGLSVTSSNQNLFPCIPLSLTPAANPYQVHQSYPFDNSFLLSVLTLVTPEMLHKGLEKSLPERHHHLIPKNEEAVEIGKGLLKPYHTL